MALQPQKLPSQLPLAPGENFDHGDRRVVVADPLRHTLEELERPAMPFQKGLRALPRKDLDEDRSRVRQRHHEQRDLGLLASQPDRRLAEVDLGLTRRMRQRQKDFLLRLLPGPDRVLHHRVAALVTVLVAQPLEDPSGRVSLLLRRLPVVGEDLVNDRQKWLELALRPWLALPVTRWLLVGQDLLQRVPTQTVLAACATTAQLAGQHLSANVSPKLHVGTHSSAFLSRGVRSGNGPPSCIFTGLHSCA